MSNSIVFYFSKQRPSAFDEPTTRCSRTPGNQLNQHQFAGGMQSHYCMISSADGIRPGPVTATVNDTCPGRKILILNHFASLRRLQQHLHTRWGTNFLVGDFHRKLQVGYICLPLASGVEDVAALVPRIIASVREKLFIICDVSTRSLVWERTAPALPKRRRLGCSVV